jgi:hypothetical protein
MALEGGDQPDASKNLFADAGGMLIADAVG